MTRPKITNEKYAFPHCEDELERRLAYEDDLETYCDALEELLRFYKRALNARCGLSVDPSEGRC